MSVECQELRHILNADYECVVGSPFRHFFCPILYRDEDTQLCRAHVINKAFRDSDRSWTIQRADVDAYYGSLFERDFLAIEKKDSPMLKKALADKVLASQFKPKIVLDGEVQDHYYVGRNFVPENFSVLDLDLPGKSVSLVLKLSPEELLEKIDGKWEIHIDKDVRLPALVSLLKSAHLTLFHLLGYRYALSAGGYFLGKTVLGDFFLNTHRMERACALEEAVSHFKPLASLVRPIISPSLDFKGTLTDRLLYFCMNGERPWACLVLIRIANQMHAVTVPILQEEESAARFYRFLHLPFSCIEVRTGRISSHAIEISPTSHSIEWPESLFDAELPTT